MKLLLCNTAALVSTGIMAGIFFTWTNAVTPGIGRLEDYGYLSALKSMNVAILNPAFMLAFFLPLFAIPATAVLRYAEEDMRAFGFVLAAGLIYTAGCLCITMMGNVPLNERLEGAALETLSAGDLRHLRSGIEFNWNRFNLIRTYASAVSFILLAFSICLKR